MTIDRAWVKIPTKTAFTNADLNPADLHDIDAIDAYEAYPLPQGKTAPGILVFQEVFGVNSHIRSVVDRLAQAGYRAIAPALYQRTAPGFEVGYSEADLALGRHHKDQTTAAQLLRDIENTIAYLKNTGLQNSGFGCIGFCFGGHVAYLAATLPDIKATASFYGAGIPTFTPGGGEPTIQRTSEIRGTVYGFYGLTDPLIPPEQIDQIEQALETAQVPHRIFRYPEAGHGFCCDQRSDYCPTACADAWARALALFQTLGNRE
jgi:carboxymethylenebutenolidase